MTASKNTQFDNDDQQHHQHQYQQSHNNYTQHDNHQANTNNNNLNNIQKSSSQHNNNSLIRVETFVSFSANRPQQFHVLLDKQCEPSKLTVNVTNPIIGHIETNLDWSPENNAIARDELDNHHSTSKTLQQQQKNYNKCRVSFIAPIVGLYTIIIEHSTQPLCNTRFMTKAYDLSKVFIHKTSTSCQINESYEFSVDASEAGEGQLEIAVNEGEIPNQVQVLNNGKCIVSFVPEESVPHMVDIKFNGHNVNGCPFPVEVLRDHQNAISYNGQLETLNGTNTLQTQNSISQATAARDDSTPISEPQLIKNEKISVNTNGTFSIENIQLDSKNLNEIVILDPSGQAIDFTINESQDRLKYSFEYKPTTVGDFVVELRSDATTLINKLPRKILQQFPFPIKVFDHNKVIVSEVTNGVVDNPIYFFIDALQAGSGNLEIRVSSTTRNVPNYPQSEANAKIRVNFTPTESIEHTIDIKFNGYPVPGNPFQVKVAPSPQARLSSKEEEKIKYVNSDEITTFDIDFIGPKGQVNLLKSEDCEVSLLHPDFTYSKLDDIKLIKSFDSNTNELEAKFKITLKPNKIGPHKFFIKVNNELLPSSPITCNVCNINEVKVTFAQLQTAAKNLIGKTDLSKLDKSKPIALLNNPMTFTVDASRAGEGLLALVVLSGLTQNPVQTEVKMSEKATGLYELTFVPSEFAPHTIDMSFNERCLPNSPFIVDIIDSYGNIASINELQKQSTAKTGKEQEENDINGNRTPKDINATNEQVRHSNGNYQPEDDLDQMVPRVGNLNLGESQPSNNNKRPTTSNGNYSNGNSVATSSKKSLAYGLVNASNIVYLETGVLENPRNQVSLIGPRGEKVPFLLAKGSPQRGEPKKTYIEYKPKEIGTHTINVLVEGKDLRQYFLETCDPSLVRVTGLEQLAVKNSRYLVQQPIRFLIDSRDSGEIQLDNILIHGPKSRNKDGENTILGRIKSMSSSSHSSSSSANCLEYSIHRLNDHEQEVTFVPQLPGKHSIYIKCLGQQVGSSPYEIDVLNDNNIVPLTKTTTQQQHDKQTNNGLNINRDENSANSTLINDAEILQNIIVHGVSLKCSPVNSTGAFIIETNRFAQATDFDVVVTDPNNSPVDVQFYLQQDANLLAEWVPKRVGPHKIIVLYKDEHVPGSPFITEAFDPSGVFIDKIQKTVYSVNEKIEFKVDRKQAGHGELDVAISSPAGNELPIDVKQLSSTSEVGNQGDEEEVGELISFVPPVPGKYKLSILFGGFEIPNSPVTFTVRDTCEPPKLSGNGLRGTEVNRNAQSTVETGPNNANGQLEVGIECGDREIVPKVDQIGFSSYKQVAGCPTVNVEDTCDASRVLCTGDGLKGGVFGEEIKVLIDTRRAGPGELTALCMGPQTAAVSELLDRGDGTFILYIKPQEAGRHILTIKYGGQQIPKSPFAIKISGRPDPSKVRVHGPGIEHGVLSLYQSRFTCDTRGAGAGQLTVRIRGPKGAFRMETQRSSQRDRTILCKYDPTEPGDYRIEIKWSGQHVPGSPFHVMIFDTQEELNRFLRGLSPYYYNYM